MFSRIVTILSALCVLLVSATALAEAPAIIPVQGYVTDAEGTPLTGMHAFEVNIYDAATAGTTLFTDQQMVDVDNGYFTFYVGRGDALDFSIFRDNGVVYFGFTIDDEAELSPRTELGSVPFAAYAQYAGTVDFADVTNVPADLIDGDAVLQAGNGLTETSGTLDVDTTTIQGRVTGTCQPGEAIQMINEDGTVTCETDDDTTYQAGTGIALANGVFSIDAATIQNRVSGTCSASEKLIGVNADGSVTCATDLDTDTDTDTTYNAGAGLALAGTTFSVNTSAIQARVTGTCPVGQSIRSIGANGTVTCEVDTDTDTDTTYSAGSGLTLSGTSFAVNTSVIQARVTGTCPVGQSIRTINANGTVTCEVDTDTDTTYTAGTGLTLTGTTFSLNTTGRMGTWTPANSTGALFAAQASNWLGILFRIDGGGTTGRLEVTRDNGVTWGTVCDDGFNDDSARVACRSMGYSDGTAVSNTLTVDGVDPILLDNFQCSPDSRNLLECRVAAIGTENCVHTEDVGVTCIP